MEARNDEDRIIEILRIEGMLRLYEDLDFLPVRQSLYEIEDIAPNYDEIICHTIAWLRPHDISKTPEYFFNGFEEPRVVMGSLPNDVFIGTLMAVCAYTERDLLENIFASRPEDFKTCGVYTCRFYVDGGTKFSEIIEVC